MSIQFETYLMDGCGRCSHYKTPECKVLLWTDALIELRKLVLECGLKEEFKWSNPCYSYNGHNVIMVSALRTYACLSFFKGSLLKDPNNLLHKPGENSQAARIMKFVKKEDVLDKKEAITGFIKDAIELEKEGKKVSFDKQPEPIPEELMIKFAENPTLEKAFKALTPGRQRGYILYFSQAKQSKTRIDRIEKYTSKILEGKGFHDDYRAVK